jgi:indole-3-glycerol phosphate synthase
MHQRLAEILAVKKDEVAELKKNIPAEVERDLPPRDFKAAISAPGRINLIAEIKFASPSAGRIRAKCEPDLIGKIYEDAGAAAISLLTDKRFFQGDLNHLPNLKKTVALPVVRKDFIIDEVQVCEALLYGADAILLIARILSRARLSDLISACRELGMSPLTEVHDRDDLEKAIECGAEIIGINNRDLDSFTVDVRTTFELAPLVPEDRIVISESGLATQADIRSLRNTGVRAVLVGSALMRNDDLAGKTTELVQAGIIA